MFLHDALTVAKKELKAFFSDKAILAQILILPFAMVFGYALLMSTMNSTVEDEDSSDSTGTSAYSVKGTAYAVNIPDFMQQGFDEMGFKTAEEADAESIREDISRELAQLLVIFPEDFKFPETAEDKLSDIEIWYNIENDDSFEAYNLTTSYLSSYRPTLYTINSSDKKYDLGDSSAFIREFMGTILPIMILTGVFTVCMNLAAETIAGDKERGFLNTMLIAPVKRSSIAAGKSIAIFVASALGGLSACIGMAAGLPKLSEMFAGSEDISITYSLSEYALLFSVTITAVFAVASILLIISVLAKDVKQATNVAPAVMMVLMIGGFLTTAEGFNNVIEELGTINFVIPAWNSIICLKDIMSLDHTMSAVAITCAANLIFSIIAVFITGRLFENEKIVNG